MTNNKNKTRIERLPEEAKNQLVEYVNELIDDANNYDSGKIYTIKRSSVILRSLYHDTRNQIGLLNQLGEKEYIKFYSYSNPTQKDIYYYGQLLQAIFFDENSDSKLFYTFLFHPLNDIGFKKITFQDWWNGDIIKIPYGISRKNLITIMANQDGGAHFDPHINEIYANLKSGQMGYKIEVSPGVLIDFKHIELAMMRQVVHETITSLIDWYNLKINYEPNFNLLWSKRLNNFGWQVNVKNE